MNFVICTEEISRYLKGEYTGGLGRRLIRILL